MQISKQASTVLVVQLIQMVTILIAILVSPVSTSVKAWSVVSIIVFMGLGVFLIFYAINCMVYGNCNLFAWIIAGIILVFFVMAVLSSIVGIAAAKKYQNELNQMWAYSMSKLTPGQYAPSHMNSPPPSDASKKNTKESYTDYEGGDNGRRDDGWGETERPSSPPPTCPHQVAPKPPTRPEQCKVQTIQVQPVHWSGCADPQIKVIGGGDA